MDQSDLDKTKERLTGRSKEVAQVVSGWLRRRTCLSEEEILEKVLKPVANMAFEAGWEVGNQETMLKVQREVRRARISRWISLVLSAVCLAVLLSY